MEYIVIISEWIDSLFNFAALSPSFVGKWSCLWWNLEIKTVKSYGENYRPIVMIWLLIFMIIFTNPKKQKIFEKLSIISS
jgi:hypothetical protein